MYKLSTKIVYYNGIYIYDYRILFKRTNRTHTFHRTYTFHRTRFTKTNVPRTRFRSPFRIEPSPM